MSDLPPEIEATIAEHERRVTEQLRAALGREDVVVVFDRTPILLSPEKRRSDDRIVTKERPTRFLHRVFVDVKGK